MRQYRHGISGKWEACRDGASAKVLCKVGNLLRLCTTGQPEHTVSKFERAIDNSISGTDDFLYSLGRIGLLCKAERGRYRLG